MISLTPSVQFFLNLAKVQAVMSRRFDAGLGGLGFSEFIILYRLSQAEDEKLRRIDLADKVGLTASGVTRLLAPMEKVGLIKREANADDARVSLVSMAPGGRRRLEEALERAEMLSDEALPDIDAKKLTTLSEVLAKLA